MARRKKNGRYEPKAKRDAEAEVKATKEHSNSVSLGAALQRFIQKHEVVEGEAGAIAAAAEYLKPFLERLHKIEKDLPEFPPNTTVPWAEIESVVMDQGDHRTMGKVAESYGVQSKHMYEMSRRRKWKARVAVLRELTARTTTARALAGTASILAGDSTRDVKLTELEQEEQLAGLVEDCINVFKEAVHSGQAQFRNAKDLDTLVRLMAFLKGRAEKITENRHRIDATELEGIAAKVMKRLNFSPELAGVVKDADYTMIGDERDVVPVTDPSDDDAA